MDTSSNLEGLDKDESSDNVSVGDEPSEASKGWIKVCDPYKPGDDPRELRSYIMAFNEYKNYSSIRVYPSRG